MQLSREVGDLHGLAATLANLGDLELHEGHVDRAREAFEESRRLWREVGQPEGLLVSIQNLGVVSLAAGDSDGAASYFRDSLGLARELGDTRCTADAVEAFAAVAADRGDGETAARLLGAAERLREETGHILHRVELGIHERTVAKIAATLPDAHIAAATAAGRELTTDEALELVSSLD